MTQNFLSINIEEDTINNPFYRRVIYTDLHMQLVLMSLKMNESIGWESHAATQFIRVESGNGIIMIESKDNKNIGNKISITDGSVVIIPSNSNHNVLNTGDDELKLYTIYSPPQHPPNLIQKIKIT